jgi:hypothetical protein
VASVVERRPAGHGLSDDATAFHLIRWAYCNAGQTSGVSYQQIPEDLGNIIAVICNNPTVEMQGLPS